MGSNSFSDEQALHFLLNEKWFSIDVQFGTLFQSIKEVPDLKRLAENMQASLFQKLINEDMMKPKVFADLLVNPYGSGLQILKLARTNPMFSTLDAYTLQFAAHRGGMEGVNKLFADNKPEAALAVAMKV